MASQILDRFAVAIEHAHVNHDDIRRQGERRLLSRRILERSQNKQQHQTISQNRNLTTTSTVRIDSRGTRQTVIDGVHNGIKIRIVDVIQNVIGFEAEFQTAPFGECKGAGKGGINANVPGPGIVLRPALPNCPGER